MTVDAEDALAYPVWTGDPIASFPNNTHLGASTTIGPVRVDQFQGIELFLNDQAQGIDVFITWWTDETTTIQTGVRQWSLQQGDILQAIEPNLGPVVQVLLTSSAGDAQVGGSIIPVNAQHDRQRSTFRGNLADVIAQNINNGASLTTELRPYRGPVVLFWQVPAGALTVSVRGIDHAGTEVTRYYHNPNAGLQNIIGLNLAGLHNRVILTNNDTVAHNYTLSVVAEG